MGWVGSGHTKWTHGHLWATAPSKPMRQTFRNVFRIFENLFCVQLMHVYRHLLVISCLCVPVYGTVYVFRYAILLWATVYSKYKANL